MSTSLFDYPDDLRHFTEVARKAITMAHDLGWSVRWAKNGPHSKLGVLYANDGTNYSINIPTTNVNANRARSWVKQIRRHSDEDAVERWLARQERPEKRPIPVPPQPRPEPPKPTPPKTAPPQAEHPQAEQPTLVSSNPWLVHLSGHKSTKKGRVYESQFVTEEHWSDGSIIYRCTMCPYSTSNKPRSVSAHASQAHRGEYTHETYEELVARSRTTASYEATGITRNRPTGPGRPGKAQSRRLVADILTALDQIEEWGSMTAEDLAERIVVIVDENRPDPVPREPLSDAQVLHRIALLVDNGRLAELHNEMRTLSDRLAEEHEKVEALLADRRALRDLLSDSEEVAKTG